VLFPIGACGAAARGVLVGVARREALFGVTDRGVAWRELPLGVVDRAPAPRGVAADSPGSSAAAASASAPFARGVVSPKPFRGGAFAHEDGPLAATRAAWPIVSAE
jgi:hypothetical protein